MNINCHVEYDARILRAEFQHAKHDYEESSSGETGRKLRDQVARTLPSRTLTGSSFCGARTVVSPGTLVSTFGLLLPAPIGQVDEYAKRTGSKTRENE